MISRLLRLYKRSYGIRQICNIVVYILHSACTIHLLNLPDTTAKRDILHGVRQLEEISQAWLVARRTLCILALQAKRWEIEVPEEAAMILSRVDEQYGQPSRSEHDESFASSSRLSQDPVTNELHDEAIAQDMWNLGDATHDYADQAINAPFLTTTNASLDSQQLPISEAQMNDWLGFENLESTGNTAAGNNTDHKVSESTTAPTASAPHWTQQQADSVHMINTADYGSEGQAQNYNDTFGIAGRQNNQMRQILDLQRQRQDLEQQPNSSNSSNMQSATHHPQSTTSPDDSTKYLFGPSQALSSGNRISPASQLAAVAQASMPHFQPQQGYGQAPHSTDYAISKEMLHPDVNNANGKRKPSAASDMFGGVQALLREGREWWVSDQGQVAHGFGRWDT